MSPLRTLLLVFALALLTSSATFAQRLSPAAAREKVDVQTDVEYGKAGDRSLKLDVIKPKEASEKPRPCVVWIHGGGWQNGNKSSGHFRLTNLVASGDYVGVTVGYRLTDETAWPGQIHDCKAAVRWIRANAKTLGVDPDKIGVMGSSAGGHLVSMLGTSGDVKELEGKNGSPDNSSRVSCVVDFCGPSDFLAINKDNPKLNDPSGPVYKLLGGPITTKEDVAKEASPVTHVSADDPPFLILHGTDDRTVDIRQAEILHSAQQKAGTKSTFVKITGGGHGIGGPKVEERVKTFLDKHLLGKDVEVSSEAIEAAPMAVPAKKADGKKPVEKK
ncbi:Carboxylesterase NlhH [Anatilimnocola aggregata]|uniref:Carboxylesterase NlhH n=1 Tax=Anatilimnocola aggregata TaxID=2528021 RepID=A0A517YB19_9BACT|nr:alpha/beta hydrolase [Anatilimnocola aggregata]QDU27446.1 Carboxylesterase NlhH [Anatilimnocola aggregata]